MTMTQPSLILASASPARTALLRQAGIRHRVQASSVDEEAISAAAGPLTPAETALLLARAKAENIATQPESRGGLVLGCDSVFEFGGLPYGKPHRAEIAQERISQLSGQAGVLHTGHWLVDCRRKPPSTGTAGTGMTDTEAGLGALASAVVHFGTLSPEEIDAYVATGEPLEVAGSFTLDSLGSAFIERVEGDPHAVVGLSVSTLRDLLSHRGIRITDLWDTYKE